MKSLYLKKNEEKRIIAGHLWVFSNEVDVKKKSLSSFEPGEPVRIVSQSGTPLASGYVNPKSLICARIMSRDAAMKFDSTLLRERVRTGLALRQKIFKEPYYRLVFGESDRVPGLVVDRFGDILVVQVTTAGMERLIPDLQDILVELISPKGILWKNDASSREMEGLPSTVNQWGDVPRVGTVLENGITYSFPLTTGQKTGWYFDQRENRRRFAAYCREADSVLDLFSYVGGTAVLAARSGARRVVCVDSSAQALEYVDHNSRENRMESRIESIAGDGFDVLKSMRGERFSVVMLDPPAFIKRKKDVPSGMEAYTRLNTLALNLVQKSGILISCSCSQHLSLDGLMNIVRRSGLKSGRNIRVLEFGHQDRDHPVHPAMPETNYLKAVVCWVE
ncbi:MAG: class I SAM-dependent rRNA methyltransferase [Desulfovibrionales bacterium]